MNPQLNVWGVVAEKIVFLDKNYFVANLNLTLPTQVFKKMYLNTNIVYLVVQTIAVFKFSLVL